MIDFSAEIKFKTARSSGPGGQNVNKVETAVTAIWDYSRSSFFSGDKKNVIALKLSNKINSDGVLQIMVSETRSQLQNKEIAIARLLHLVDNALIIPKARLKTKVSFNQKQKRLDTKKKNAEKKEQRRFRF